MEPNRLSISTKADCSKKDMYTLIDMLYDKFSEDEITVDYLSKTSSYFDIIFSDDQFEQILKLIAYCRSIEEVLPILENKKIQFGFKPMPSITSENEATVFGIDSMKKIAKTRRVTGVKQIYSNLKDKEYGEKDNEGYLKNE